MGSITTWNSEVFLPVAKQPALTSFIHGCIQRSPIFHLSDCLYKIWLKRRGIEAGKIHQVLQTYSNNGGIYIEATAQVMHRSTEGSLDVRGKSRRKHLKGNYNLKEGYVNEGLELDFLKALYVGWTVSSSFCFQVFNKMCRYLALVCLSFALLAVSRHVYSLSSSSE